MKQFYINHPQDIKDATDAIREMPFPFVLIAQRMAATPEHEDEYSKRRRLMAYFHRNLVPEYANVNGVDERQAKGELQCKFARCGEVHIDEAGEFDVVWINNDKFFNMESGKHYWVESVASMGNDRLVEFCNNIKDYLLTQHGVFVKEFINNVKTKKIK